MSKFNAFMKGSVKAAEEVKMKLDRFPEEIVLRPLTAGEADKINERCFVNKTGRKGKQERSFDVVRYNRGVCSASIIYPDLNDAALQESYGVRGAEELYAEMFLFGESAQILEKVTEISGLNESLDDDIEEAKN
ncbi:phage tail assembly chaperone [Sporosarcina trichiuri]|uniref:phage tail assembly chaperone n=1 Tax=Sporosarcina trichiuri TaxID=3056445 RepID=UPI0025B3A479|nr:phage portal protein [Sporosarcina sp. 0.2-SM1T-5]WJY27478.1 phage portal protein [Sporosarcina sp. 0.2-SM1T-5]